MIHSEIVRILSDRTGMSKKDVKQLLAKIAGSLGSVLGEYTGFSIPELGTFGTHIREERKAYSIPDARNMIIPPKRLVYFGPATDLKDEFKGAATEFDDAEIVTDTPPPVAPVELSEHEQMQQEMAAEAEARRASEAAAAESDVELAPDDE